MPTASKVVSISTVTMRVIAQPNLEVRTIMLCGNAPYRNGAPPGRGRNYVCGACGAVLIENGQRGPLRHYAFKCGCGKCNEIP
jgi:hypothetical protein